MKIGVITFHGADNYGSVLQAYALTEYLNDKGYDAEIIDYYFEHDYRQYKPFRTYLYSRQPKAFLSDVFSYSVHCKRIKNFQNFRKEFLKLSSVRIGASDGWQEIASYYDCFICGSDQIWNLNCTNGVCGPYFLDFVSGKRKIAYAPSMGDYLLLDNDREKMRKALEEFYAISVREASMIQMLEQLNLPISIQTVVDPTLLLKKEDYIQGLKLEKMVSAGKYIFVYILGGTKAYGNIVNEAKKIAKRNGLQIKYVFDNNNAMIKNIGFDCSGCNPREFVSMIYNAEYVLTNSFHATVFSIIFKKNFTSYARGKSSGRITELLSSLGLEERFNLESNGCIIAINSYDKVYQLLANMKIESMIYLENALNVEGINSNE